MSTPVPIPKYLLEFITSTGRAGNFCGAVEDKTHMGSPGFSWICIFWSSDGFGAFVLCVRAQIYVDSALPLNFEVRNSLKRKKASGKLSVRSDSTNR
jgi:hypothetical protein